VIWKLCLRQDEQSCEAAACVAWFKTRKHFSSPRHNLRDGDLWSEDAGTKCEAKARYAAAQHRRKYDVI